MTKLTKRTSGITEGYGSGYNRDDLIQKLGTIEYTGPELAKKVCSLYCRHREDAEEYGLEFICEACPMTALMEMID